MNLKDAPKGQMVQVVADPPIPIYGVQRGALFAVFENCMTSESKAGLVCVQLIPESATLRDKYVYFNAEDFGRFVKLIPWKVLT